METPEIAAPQAPVAQAQPFTDPPAPPISGLTRLFPVVGSPVSQVKAPLAFNALFAQAGVDARVVPLELPGDTVVATCRALLASPSVGGLLVTVPYKKTLLAAADRLGPQARRAGALNALRHAADGAIEGELFDGLGFVAGLRAAGHAPEGLDVLLLGAGGAGCAIASALADVPVRRVQVYDPVPGLAVQLVRRLAGLPTRFEPLDDLPAAEQADLVVNATPLGMRETDPLPIDPATLADGTVVADVIMSPARTALLARATALGLPTHPGRPMLDHQLPAYLDFFGLPQVGRLAGAALAGTRA